MRRRDLGFLSIGLGLGLSLGVGIVAQMIWLTHAFILGVSNRLALFAVASVPLMLVFGGATLVRVSRRGRSDA